MPELAALVFYFFSGILILASAAVITVRNPVHAALFLVLAFFSAAALWMLLKAEFLAIALVLVYVGAVMVLFLFVVMMLDINVEEFRRQFRSHLPVGLLVGAVVAIEMMLLLALAFSRRSGATSPHGIVLDGSNSRALGVELFTRYVYAVEIAGVLLLVAIIAAIALTLRERRGSKYQDPAEQVRVRREDRLRVLKLTSERPTPVTASKASQAEGGASSSLPQPNGRS
ncbi:MAG: NADH-quinone oxidoreductase subunit J [Casimicrobiaceae bacterium]|nr:NADH-quinone oxidoreductase subunit J [Casimicrobiaceae bacterium]MCX8098337.1 NADH-quinone oxidoreductase subunit J [Casimicrobiaceae bacterium]MDW8311323.1 NADH-quinone oxidoreductase subunit J [Burkholderiales bacterium]